jgi:hypothetical protein
MDEMHQKAMALTDGELPPRELPSLIQEMARNNALLQWAQSLLRNNRHQIESVYAKKREEVVPQWMHDLVMTAPMGAPAPEAAHATSNVVSYGKALLDRLRRRYRMPGWSIAAGPAFASALAISATWLLLPAPSQSATLMTAALQDALERTVDGHNPALPGFAAQVTYWSNDQTWCRQFDMATRVERTYAVACRSNEGQWRVVLQTPPRPSAAGVAADPRGPLNGYITANQSGPVLAPSQLQEAIRSGWEPPAGR